MVQATCAPNREEVVVLEYRNASTPAAGLSSLRVDCAKTDYTSEP